MYKKSNLQLKPSLKQKPTFSFTFNQYLDTLKLSNQEVRKELLALLRPNPWLHFDDQRILDQLHQYAQEGIRNDLYYQLNTTKSKVNTEICTYIIDSLDEHGFFNQDEPSPYPQTQLNQALRFIQSLEPEGIGLKNSVDYLCLQLKKKEAFLSLEILLNCEELMIKQDLLGIQKKLNITEDQLNHALSLIRSCRLYPCEMEAFSPEWIEPDVILEIKANELIITPAMQKFSPFLLDSNQLSPQTKDYLKQANLMLDMLNQRNLTLLQIIHALTTIQHDTLFYGSPLKPCRLQDVSLLSGVHPSTISRCCPHKYYQFQGQIKPFSSLFAAGSIQGKSHDELYQILLELLEQEDKENPWQDEQLVVLFKEKGISLSRRGLANLRKKWNIPNSYKRKVQAS